MISLLLSNFRFLLWSLGCRSLEDYGALAVESALVPRDRPREPGGKGPNRHIAETCGAGPGVLHWISGELSKPVRLCKYMTD